jgi:hypothetical protein
MLLLLSAWTAAAASAAAAARTDAKFQDTGLERSAALASDLAYMQQQHKLPPPEIKEDGPGMTYAKHLKQLAASDPQSFICHYYNYYFAHTAGGRMIGKKVRRQGQLGVPHVFLAVVLKALAVVLCGGASPVVVQALNCLVRPSPRMCEQWLPNGEAKGLEKQG